MSVIEEAVAKIEDWKGKNISIKPLSGGLTNTNYKVEVDGRLYFVRVPGESTELLAVDRDNEYHNTKAAAEAGVAPQVIHYLLEYCVMVLAFLDGKTMSKDSLNASGMPPRMAQSIKRLHVGRRFITDFNMFRLTEYYLNMCKERDIRIPDGYLDRMFNVEQNEVGAAYFGEVSSSKIARMKLNMIMSDVSWGLWAAIQAKISTIDFDFWGWAVEKMDSAEFRTWLKEVEN
jgi:thiamine kinase-like enzyme